MTHPTLLATQITFFAKNRFLELEEFLSSEEEQALCTAIGEALGNNKEKTSLQPYFFKQGHDLWRKSSFLQSWVIKNAASFLLLLYFDYPFPSFSQTLDLP